MAAGHQGPLPDGWGATFLKGDKYQEAISDISSRDTPAARSYLLKALDLAPHDTKVRDALTKLK